MKRLLIVHRSPGFAGAVAERLKGAYIIRPVYDGVEASRLLEEFRPHGLLVHTAIPRKDGLSLLEQTPHRPDAVVVTTDYLDTFTAARAGRLGVGTVLLMPTAQTAALMLSRLLEQESPTPLIVWLQSLGFRPSLAGCRLLLGAAEIMKKDPGLSLSGEVYPKLGEPRSVEKAIRTAIHTAWQEGERQAWRKYFPQNRCPGNRAFLAVLLQLYRHGSADGHGVFRDGTIHSQNFHTGLCGLPESGAEGRVGGIVGVQEPYIFHLDDEQHEAAAALFDKPCQLPQVPGSPEGRGIGEGTYAIMLQRDSLDL